MHTFDEEVVCELLDILRRQNTEKAIADPLDAALLEAALARCLELLPTLSLATIAELNYCIGRNYYTLPQAGRDTLNTINEHVLQQVREGGHRKDPNGLPHIPWMCLKLGMTDEKMPLMTELLDVSADCVDKMNAEALACMVFTCGKIDYGLAPEAREAVRARALALQDTFTPLEVSTILQGFAAMQIEAPEVFSALLRRFHDFVIGKQGIPIPAYKGDPAKSFIKKFEPRHNKKLLRQLLWALAAAQAGDQLEPDVKAALSASACEGMCGETTRGLEVLIWACKRSMLDMPDVYSAAVAAIEPRLQSMLPEHLSGMTWSFLDHTLVLEPRWLQTFAAAILPAIPQQDVWTLLRVATMFSQRHHYHEPLLAAICQRMEELPIEVNFNDCMYFLMNLSNLGYDPGPQVTSMFTERFLDRLSNPTPEMDVTSVPMMDAVADMIWALAIVGRLRPAVCRTILDKAAQVGMDLTGPTMNQPNAFKLVQAVALMNAEGTHGASLLEALPRDVGEHVFLLNRSQMARSSEFVRTSSTQRAVAEVVESLGYDYVLEEPACGGLATIDICIRMRDGQKVALEVDGPSHLCANAPHRPMGPTLARNRMVAADGYRVISVSTYDWEITIPKAAKLNPASIEEVKLPYWRTLLRMLLKPGAEKLPVHEVAKRARTSIFLPHSLSLLRSPGAQAAMWLAGPSTP
ncbi:hypothetical protein WJX81_002310 [Elliptochloris bilobata]|uniref:RAP domain-containing protein n=1 Tax=Elliptochloris bilobata TaxID=381761 RepID=A0AAW1QKE5_9CHLO